MAERYPRVGTQFRITFTHDFDTDNIITAGTITIREETAGTVVINAAALTVEQVTANRKYRTFYAWTPAAAGDYKAQLNYTATQPLDDDQMDITVWPLTTKYDPWFRRVKDWLQESDLGEAAQTLGDRSYQTAVDAAVEEYGRRRPKVTEWEQALTADDWTYALPAGWILGFSQIIRPEYPVDATLQGRSFLLPSDIDIDEADSILYLNNHTPSAGQSARFLFLGGYTLSHTVDNLPAGHTAAISKWATGEALEMLANRAAGTEAPQIQAQGVNMRDVTQRYQSQAEKFKRQAREMWRDTRVFV